MRIRLYSQSDRRPCLEILESNTPEFFIPQDCAGYAAFLDDLPGPYFVLEEFGQTAACGGWALDAAGVADLTWGMVRREFHRRGLGRELLRFRLNAIRNDGRATLVRVRTAQLVQGFFVREGFNVVDVVPNGFGAGLDKVTMETVLPPNHTLQRTAASRHCCNPRVSSTLRSTATEDGWPPLLSLGR
jgi:GNAT superfamily N-acetyltransferase